ncbi:hypothetical protein ACQ4PT_060843 [Festuca glaucescens]
MVAGRVKAVMGFHHSSPRAPKSPAPHAEEHTRTPARVPPTAPGGSASKASAFARSLGAYFPRSTSAQVQPARAPPEVAGLLRAIEQLQERESRLRVELLEQKILKETVAIVPFLEAELAAKSNELERYRESAVRLESQNMRLCAELDAAVLEATSRKQRIVQMEKEMAELRKQQEALADDCCSSSASVSVEHHESSNAAPNTASLAPLQPPPFVSKSSFPASPASSSSSSASSSTSTSPADSGSSSSGTSPVPRTRVPELSKLPPIPPPPPPRPPLIRSDVEKQGDLIRFLIKEVEAAAFAGIEDVVVFVKWLDDELSRLVDERAVLKHFEWPEQKADALREAAFGYRDLKKLEGEAASFRDDARLPCAAALKKMQALFEK